MKEIEDHPTVVVSAYERKESLTRLLASIAKAIDGDNPVIIVVGRKSGNEDVLRIAKKFSEKIPSCEVIHPTVKMGLVEQFLFIGDLTKEVGSIILLEDDLVVSDSFYDFATQALTFFRGEKKVGGICLNSLPFNGYTKMPFIPVDDGTDTFFAQVPFFHGQAYTKEMWNDFRRWLDRFDGYLDHLSLPSVFKTFPPDEWFPTMTQYLLETSKYFVFPRIAFAVNFGEPGKHFKKPTQIFQTPLAHNRDQFRFNKFTDSGSIYDVFQDLIPALVAKDLGISDPKGLTVDINGAKSLQFLNLTEEILTTKPVSNRKLGFGSLMRPLEENILNRIEGDFISLTTPDRIKHPSLSNRIQHAKLLRYHFPMHGISYFKRIKAFVLKTLFS